jgi:hypothetical protein
VDQESGRMHLLTFSPFCRRANFAKLTIPLNTPRPSTLGPGTLERNAVRDSRATPTCAINFTICSISIDKSWVYNLVRLGVQREMPGNRRKFKMSQAKRSLTWTVVAFALVFGVASAS